MSDLQESAGLLAKTGMLASEVLVPGASTMIAGNTVSGVGHLVATGVIVALLAPTMPLLAAVAAIGFRVNSYQQATTGTSAMGAALQKARATTGLASA